MNYYTLLFDKEALAQAKVLTRGLPASPGAATGQIVFFADDAAKWHEDGHKVIMVRIETSPEDLAGMNACGRNTYRTWWYDFACSSGCSWHG